MKTIKSLFTILLLLCATVAAPHDLEVDGIYYKVLSKEDKTLEVIFKGGSYYSYSDEYSGNVIIPSTVTQLETNVIPVETFDAWNSTNNEDNTTSENKYTLDVKAGYALKFDWSVSSESGYDWLTITLDGEEIIKKSGTTLGCYEKIFDTEGVHTLVVTYSKDGGISSGSDEGKIDNVILGVADGMNEIVYRVVSIGEDAFRSTGITSVTIPGSVINIRHSAFNNSYELTSVTFGDGVKSIGEYAFLGCSKLKSVEFPNSVTSIGNYAFSGCDWLAKVVFGDGNISIGEGAFASCRWLANVTIGNGVISIGDNAFDGCSYLSAVYISDLSAWCNIDFGNAEANPLYYAYRFYLNGEQLTDVVIPDGVEVIKKNAFIEYYLMTSVVIPSSVTSIGYNAFDACSGLTSITSWIPAEKLFVPQSNAFYDVDKTECILYVPYGAKEAYETTEGWNQFTNIVEMEPTDIDKVKGELTDYRSQNGKVETIYDLQGRKVGSPNKGLNIIDGKKVLVK